VYRVVREALTNVRKHAPGARVLVRVSYDPSQVRLEVRNRPPADPAGPAQAGLARTGSGLGIAGLRQRMLDKLQCANRTQAGLLAHDAGLVGR